MTRAAFVSAPLRLCVRFLMPMNMKLLLNALLLALSPSLLYAADLCLGSGAKAGETTARSAIVLVRLTATPGQNERGLIPGREGQARLHYSPKEDLHDAGATNWETANPE